MFKKLWRYLPLLALAGCFAIAATVGLTWDAPLEYEDGSPIGSTPLYYTVHWGLTQCPANVYPTDCQYQNVSDAAQNLMHNVNVPSDGQTYYFAVTARTATSGESRYSDEVSITTVDARKPNRPSNVVLQIQP